MGYFDDMVKKMQQDNAVPQKIWDRLEITLENLPDYPCKQNGAQMEIIGNTNMENINRKTIIETKKEVGNTATKTKKEAENGAIKTKKEAGNTAIKTRKEAGNAIRGTSKKSGKFTIWKKAGAAAAVLIAGFVVCYSNPVLASRIPFLNKIFERIEDNVPFSGDYSQKADPLTQEGTNINTMVMEEQHAVSDKNTAANTNGITITDNGITITASEVYCDGLSVFLSAQIYAEQGGFSNIPAHYVSNTNENSTDMMADMLYLRGDWKLSDESEWYPLTAYSLEGKVIDDHTFAGMLKLDMNAQKIEQGNMTLQLSSIGWDDTTISNPDNIAEAHRIDGNWNFNIPYHTDRESVKEIEVNRTANGFTVKKVFVSPYQVVTYIDTPTEYVEKNITRADYEKKLGLKEGEEAPDMDYQQYIENQTTRKQPCETVVCNQNGELLAMGDMSTTSGITTFAVNKKTLSTLHIYLFTDYEDYENADGTINMELAAQRAIVSAEISLD